MRGSADCHDRYYSPITRELLPPVALQCEVSLDSNAAHMHRSWVIHVAIAICGDRNALSSIAHLTAILPAVCMMPAR